MTKEQVVDNFLKYEIEHNFEFVRGSYFGHLKMCDDQDKQFFKYNMETRWDYTILLYHWLDEMFDISHQFMSKWIRNNKSFLDEFSKRKII